MPRRNSRSVSEELAKQSGAPRYLGTIVATTVKSNETTAAPFNNSATYLLGKTLLIQSDADCYILPTAAAGEAGLTSSNGVRIFANERVVLEMDDFDQLPISAEALRSLTALAVAGTANVKVWELK